MIEFGETVEFDELLYQDNINRHEFPETDEKDGKGVVKDE